jgi:hypothetical protein
LDDSGSDPAVYTVHCPLCETPVRFEKVGGRSLAYEPWVDTDQLCADAVWVLHSEDRCRFAALIAASGLDQENGT